MRARSSCSCASRSLLRRVTEKAIGSLSFMPASAAHRSRAVLVEVLRQVARALAGARLHLYVREE
eukprot:4989682-Alexandrium_andersonii.AAC.1